MTAMADPPAANGPLQDVPSEMARMDRNVKTSLLSGAAIACGLLGFALLMWTPTTGGGILVYVALFAVLAIAALILFSRNRGQS